MKKSIIAALILSATGMATATAASPDQKLNKKSTKNLNELVEKLNEYGISSDITVIDEGGDIIKIGHETKTIVGSGVEASELRDIKYFKQIRTSASIDVVLTQGKSYKVEVKADKNILPYVKTYVSSGMLMVTYEENISIKPKKVYTVVHVTAPEINALSATSSGDIIINGVLKTKDLQLSSSSSGDVKGIVECDGDLTVRASSSGDVILKGRAQNGVLKTSSSSDIMATLTIANDVSLTCSSSGDITLETTAESCKAVASSSGDITVRGKVRTASATASSSGDVDMSALESEVVEAKASSAGEVRVWATEVLTASVSSGGGIMYKGDPKTTNISKSSGGTVKKY